MDYLEMLFAEKVLRMAQEIREQECQSSVRATLAKTPNANIEYAAQQFLQLNQIEKYYDRVYNQITSVAKRVKTLAGEHK